MLLTILANNNLNVPTSTAGQTWMMWTNSPRPPEPEPEVVRTDHGRLHQFRTGYQTVGQPLWSLYWKTSARDTEDQIGGPRGLQVGLLGYRVGYQTVGQPWFALRPTPKALPIDAEVTGPQPLPNVHNFRPGFQTVGQPWFALQPAQQRPSEPDPQYTATISYSLLFGRSNIVATVAGQPWYLWTQPQRLLEPEVDPYRVDHGRLHQFRAGFQTVGQPWFALSAIPKGLPIDAEPISPQPLPSVHSFRTGYQTVGQPIWSLYWKTTNVDTADQAGGPRGLQSDLHAYRPGYQTVAQPWFVVQPQKQRQIEPEPAYGAPISYSLLFGRAGTAAPIVGQPWYLWTKPPLITEPESDIYRVDHGKAFLAFRTAGDVGFLVQAVLEGVYAGHFRNIGDVFMINHASDYSDWKINYASGHLEAPWYGWMRAVGPTTILYEFGTTLLSTPRTRVRRTIL